MTPFLPSAAFALPDWWPAAPMVLALGFAAFAWQRTRRQERFLREVERFAEDIRLGNLHAPAFPAKGTASMRSLATSLHAMAEELQRRRGSSREDADARGRSLAESRRTHEELAARLRAIYDSMEEGLMVVDPFGNILDVNRRFQDMFPGEGQAHWTGASLDSFWSACEQRYGDTSSPRLRAQPESAGAESRGWFAWDTPLGDHSFRIFTAIVRDNQAQAIGRLWIFSDHTEHRQLEERLQRAQRMEAVGRLAGGLAHDFNNLLTVILGYSQMFREALAGHPELLADAMEIHGAAERASAMTEQLLALGRKRAPEAVPALPVLKGIDGMRAMVIRSLGERIAFHEHHADPPPWVSITSSHLEQILLNLLLNARDAIEGPGRIHLSTRQVALEEGLNPAMGEAVPGNYVQITVADNGCGMSPEIRRNIFEPFYTTKAPGKGTGLGLSSVYGLVRQYRGFLDVHSEPGKGSSFHVFLPAANPKDEQLSLRIPECMAGGRERILVVDDDDSVRHLLRRGLETLGYRIDASARGDEALALARAEDFDLVISDMVMPGMRGDALAKALWNEHPRLPILFISGFAEGDLPSRPDGWEPQLLLKPLSLRELAASVRQTLASRN